MAMQLMNYYMDLRCGFDSNIENKPVRVTLEELGSMLYCTTRNVKLLLKRMAEQNWIKWTPGRGRGNASELTFLITTEEIISKEAMLLAQKGDFQGAIALIHQLKEGEGLQESFTDWLLSYFGHNSIVKEERCTDTLRFPLFKNIYTLDPAQAVYCADFNIITQVFDTLVHFNHQTGVIEPHLAHFWEVNEDHTLWTFYLRKGIRFHHGREVTAQDVRFTFLRLQDPEVNSSNAWLVEDIEDIMVSNRTTIQFKLKRSNVLFLKYTSFCIAGIIPEDIYKENKQLFSRIPIGTGPFRVERNDEFICRLKAFDEYFRVRPHLDQVEIWFLPEELKESNLHGEWGQVITDHHGKMSPPGQSSKEEDWLQIEKVSSGSSLLSFNLKKQGPQQHINFRRAVDLIFGREQLIREMGGNRFSPSSSFLPDRFQADQIAPLDLILARKLLQEMNYAGEPVLLYICESQLEDSKWLQSQCAKVGIPLVIKVKTKNDMTRVEKILEADMIIYGVVMENDYDLHIIQMIKQTNSYLGAHLSERLAAVADVKISEILADINEAGRQKRVSELIDLLGQEFAFLFLLHRSFQTSYHSSVKGVTLNELDWVDFSKIWFAPNP
jgi:MarR-like DNA-binding transcriptional regulator SgrR of sgrS sRNA